MVVWFVLVFGSFTANAQLAKHVYSLDKDSVSDESFSASDFSVVAEKQSSPLFSKFTEDSDTITLGGLNGMFDGLQLFKERNHGRILSPVSQVFAQPRPRTRLRPGRS